MLTPREVKAHQSQQPNAAAKISCHFVSWLESGTVQMNSRRASRNSGGASRLPLSPCTTDYESQWIMHVSEQLYPLVHCRCRAPDPCSDARICHRSVIGNRTRHGAARRESTSSGRWFHDRRVIDRDCSEDTLEALRKRIGSPATAIIAARSRGKRNQCSAAIGGFHGRWSRQNGRCSYGDAP